MSPFDQVIVDGPGAVLVPTVGMFVPGYLLLISKVHVRNYAQLPAKELRSIQEFLEWLLSRITPLFGRYLVFEHGPGLGADRNLHGGCIDHAHFHLIPLAEQAGNVVLKSLEFARVTDLADLTTLGDKAYALLGLESDYYTVAGRRLQGQWIRRIVAACIDKPDLWDWAAYVGRKELEETLSRLSKADITI